MHISAFLAQSEVFDRIKVRRLRRPSHNIVVLLSQPFLYAFSLTSRIIIVLVYDLFLAHSIFVDDIRQTLIKNLQVLVLT
jgi:hypothetical protein